jgi:hypothetical protein
LILIVEYEPALRAFIGFDPPSSPRREGRRGNFDGVRAAQAGASLIAECADFMAPKT